MIAAICCGWLAFVWTVLLAAGKGKAAKTREGYWEKEAGRIRRQAEQAGVSWGSRETIAIWVVSLAIAGLLYFVTGNLMLFGAGWLLFLFLPRFIIQNRKHHMRLATLTALTDSLRQLSARLPDQGSLTRAMEMVVESEQARGGADVLRVVLEEIRLGGNAKDAIRLWQEMVGLRKFDNVAETLIQANADGWTPAALKALNKSVAALENDLKAVLLVAQKAASRKKQLYLAIATAWSFPLILSMMDTGQRNIYLYSTPGKLLIFAFLALTLYVLAKGQEYLSLNVDEL
ncbi:MAG: hypothetical protein FWF83_01975 [Clostridiales bacterium]|nr:hypothetical protein [Clostridiales bacterium]